MKEIFLPCYLIAGSFVAGLTYEEDQAFGVGAMTALMWPIFLGAWVRLYLDKKEAKIGAMEASESGS